MADGKVVRPRDAASLVLLREANGRVEVLIGRRGKGARFMPGRYVFPGGRLIPSDARPWHGEVCNGESKEASPFLALKRTALRETFEETGLVLGRPATGSLETLTDHTLSPVEEAYRVRGVAPALDFLCLVGRAITPTASPIRFHARFFVADGRHTAGDLTASEELDDLRWHAVDAEPPSSMQNVTKFMLRCAIDVWRGAAFSKPPLYWHKGKRAMVRYGCPAR